ncbi:hypothetical protein CEXT_90231, partial [Caerostris extrusa]
PFTFADLPFWKTIPGDSQPGGIGVANFNPFLNSTSLLGTKSYSLQSVLNSDGGRSL